MDENLDPEKIQEVNQELGVLVETTSDVNKEFVETVDVTSDLNKSLTELNHQYNKLLKLIRGEVIEETKKSTKVSEENTKTVSESTERISRQNKEFDKLNKLISDAAARFGLAKDELGQWTTSLVKEKEQRNKSEDLLRNSLSKEEYQRIKANEYLAKQNQLFEEQATQLGYMRDLYNGWIPTTIELTKEQQNQLEKLKKNSSAEQKIRQESIKGFIASARGIQDIQGAVGVASGALGNLAEQYIKSVPALAAVNVGISALEIGLKGFFDIINKTIEAQADYDKALLQGARGEALQAKQQEALVKATNQVKAQFGALAMQAGITGIALAVMGGPVTGLINLISRALMLFGGAFAVYEGYQMQMEAKVGDIAAEINTLLAELRDKVFKGATELGNASLLGAKGITELRGNLDKMMMSMSEMQNFTKIVGNAGKELKLLGPTTVDGLNKFVDSAGYLIRSELGQELESMGIERDKIAEHTLKYMAQQQRLGIALNKNFEQVGKEAGRYVIELDKLATLTGATREEQEKARDQVMAVDELRAKLLLAKDDEEREKIKKQIDFTTQLMASGQKDLAAGAARYFAAGGAVVDENSQKFMMMMGDTGKKVLQGIGTTTENYVGAIGEMGEKVRPFLGAAQYSAEATNAITGNLATFADNQIRVEEAKKLVEEGKYKNVEEALEKTRKSTDEQMIKRTELERNQREEAIKKQNSILNQYGVATNVFAKAVDSFAESVGLKTGKQKIEAEKKADAAATQEKAKADQYAKEQNLNYLGRVFDPKARDLDFEARKAEEKAKQTTIAKEMYEAGQKSALEKAVSQANTEKYGFFGRALYDDVKLTEEQRRQVLEDFEKEFKQKNRQVTGSFGQYGAADLLGMTGAPPAAGAPPAPPTAGAAGAPPAPPTAGAAGTPQAPPAAGAAGAPGTSSSSINDLFIFSGKSGSLANFNQLEPNFKDRVVAAAIEFNRATGDKIKINSAKRDPEDQKRLWDESVRAGRPGMGSNGMPIARPGNSPHEKGQAIDIQNYRDGYAVAAMNRQGLMQTEANDPVHFALPKAEKGGVFSGPKSGYPVELHGKEAVVPLDKHPKDYPQELKTALSAMMRIYDLNNMMTGFDPRTGQRDLMEDITAISPDSNAEKVLNKISTDSREIIQKYVEKGVITGKQAVEMFASYSLEDMEREKAERTKIALEATKNIQGFKDGGIASGPESGYPTILHGKEMIIPLNKLSDFVGSIEKDLSQKIQGGQTSQKIQESRQSTLDTQSNKSIDIDRVVNIQTELMNTLVNKLDSLDNKLARANDLQQDLLTYSSM